MTLTTHGNIFNEIQRKSKFFTKSSKLQKVKLQEMRGAKTRIKGDAKFSQQIRLNKGTS